MIADIYQRFPSIKLLLADVCQRQHRLEFDALTGTKGGEAELAGIADEHDPPSDAHLLTGRHIGFEIRECRANTGNGRGDRYLNRVGIHARLGKPLARIAPDPHLLGKVFLRLNDNLCLLTAHEAQGSEW